MPHYTPTDYALLSYLGNSFAAHATDTVETLEASAEKSVKEFQALHDDQLGQPLLVTGIIDDETRASMLRVVFRNVKSTRLGTRIVQVALAEADKRVREVGKNSGPDVIRYQSMTDYSLKQEPTNFPWCAAFVSWVYEQVGVPLRESAAFNLRDYAKRTRQWLPQSKGVIPPRGAVFIATFRHTGIVVYGDSNHLYTVEGNTSSGVKNSQSDGDGLYQRVRPYSMVQGYLVVDELIEDALKN